MSKIKIMSHELANKIAAGEVIERPSSVVKELVENAIDADSSKIDIIVEEAGLKSIKIIDNGAGMDREDALLAFKRHATSKLLSEHDLFRIHTLGFRGEALPSIASVSDVTVTTSNGIDAGTHLHLRGGEILENKLTHARKGTEIIVKNLFFNTPARLKYLKTINTELGYTVDFINKMSISRPDIAFKFIHNNRVLLQTNGNNDSLNVLASIYGIDVVKKMKEASYKDQYMNLNIYYSEPDVNRTTRNYMTLVVNERIVKNNNIMRGIIEGYDTYLPIGRYPIVVIDMKIDPLLIDVNVHPAKLDIRFSNGEHIKSVIIDLIRKKLKELMYIPKIQINRPKKMEDSNVQQTIDFKQTHEFKSTEKLEDVKPVYENPVKEKYVGNDDNGLFMSESKYVEKNEVSHEIETKTSDVIHEPLKKYKEKKKIPKLYYIGQFSGTYLIAQNEYGLYMIDQHAAQERINYEYYLRVLGATNNEYYELLVPLTFEFSMNEALKIEENINNVKDIKIEKFGISSFIVREVPNWFNKGNEKEILDNIFNFLLQNKKVDNTSIFKQLAITLSCKRSIKANHYINDKEVEQLLKDLEQCDNPYTCPHGRPVIVHLSMNEIEHLFKRTL